MAAPAIARDKADRRGKQTMEQAIAIFDGKWDAYQASQAAPALAAAA